MPLIDAKIPLDRGGFIPAKVSKTRYHENRAAIILPAERNISSTVTLFTELLTTNGIYCCVPDPEVVNAGTTIQALEYVEQTIMHMKSARWSNGHISIVGFGEGGLLSYLAACHLNPKAAIIYHGIGIQNYLEDGKHIKCQTVFHFGNKDTNILGEPDHKIHAALIGKFNIAIYKYDAGESFTNEDDPVNFVSDATRRAHERTLDVLCDFKKLR